jgi:hypothetical protein
MSSADSATSEARARHERRLDDERCVDALLAESGFADDDGLRHVLLQLRQLRAAEVPPPSAEVAALGGDAWNSGVGSPGASPSGHGPAGVVRLEDWSRKAAKKRAAFTTLAVAVSLGIAGGAAAGNDTLRRGAEGTINTIVRSFPPPEATTPTPALPSGAPSPAPAVVPSPAVTAPPVVTVPAAPAPVQVPGSGPVPDAPQEPADDSKTRPGSSPDVGTMAPAVPETGGKPPAPGASPATAAPEWAGQPPAGRAGPPNDGKANGKADAVGQNAASQRGPAPGNAR